MDLLHYFGYESRYAKLCIIVLKTTSGLCFGICTTSRATGGYEDKSLPLLQNVFTWARTINPFQPLSAGVWSTSLANLNEPLVWHHDIFRKDGTPFSQEEIDTIKSLTEK
ncbi:hypothetical protein EZS27_027077 [termite gut metagenome]|uniref:Uncharacterized protein n=1 Tax=termite gut metagenome TaxID=433724 RepID=A0A5J4QNI5_9ZZZZ